MCLQRELSAAVLGQVEPAELLEGLLCHARHNAGSSGGLGGPVAHGQHPHTQINTIQLDLHIITRLSTNCNKKHEKLLFFLLVSFGHSTVERELAKTVV